MSKIDGAVPVHFDGRAYEMKASFAAILAIEEELGYGLVPLATQLVSRNFGLKELSIVIYHGLKAGGDEVKPTREQVREKVFRQGVMDEALLKAINLFIEYALNGGIEPEKKPEAAENKPKS